MRRIDFLIDDIKYACESQLVTDLAGVSDEEILQYLNFAQSRLYSQIIQTTPNLLVNEEFIDIVQGQEKYAISINAHLGAGIKQVDYKYGPNATDYEILAERPLALRKTDASSKYALFFIRQDTNILLNPIPNENITAGLRYSYYKKLRRLDLRRAQIVSLNKSGSTLNTISVNLTPSLNKDSQLPTSGKDQLNKADYICIIDRDGKPILESIPVDSYDPSAGTIVVSAGYTTTLVTSDVLNLYIVIGKYTTTHCELPDETVERYFITYATYKVKSRQGRLEECKNLISEYIELENEIMDAYGNMSANLINLPLDTAWNSFVDYRRGHR